jgi:chromosome segregation ATPase
VQIAEAEKRRNIALKEAESAKFQASEDSRRQEEALVALENALKEQELLKKDSENTINALTSRIIAYEKNLDEVRKEAETSKQRYEETLKKLEGLTRELEIETYRRKEAERKALDESIAKQEALEALRSLQQKYTEYSFEELKIATNNFDENNKLGEGGYGPVYKGKLLHTPVAIKVLARDGVYGRNEFQREVRTLLTEFVFSQTVVYVRECDVDALPN